MCRYVERLGVAEASYESVEAKREAAKPSMLAEAEKAVLIKRTVKGETCNGIDV